ncbi:MAG: hypothetical protein Q9196_006980 [Gyalolechia fulgens]
MDQLKMMCHEGKQFPMNLPPGEYLEYFVTSYYEQLNRQQHRLFSLEQDSELTFREYAAEGEAFWNINVCNQQALISHLDLNCDVQRPDPKCRFLFVHAPHSRAKLKTTREMLMQSLTYFQVMPEFLDFVFPLGERVVAQDFYSDGFYQRTRLSEATQGLNIPGRAWSGQGIELCYSLKSVERSEHQTDWPWSIRHCATHHTFDVMNIRSTWVIVKGNQLIEKRMTSATSGRGPPEFSSYDSIDRAFAASLALHTILIDWSVENWRWYINFLQDQFEDLTKEAIFIDADLVDMGDIITPLPHTDTQISSKAPRLFRTHSRRTNIMQSGNDIQLVPAQKYHVNPRSGKRQPLPPGRSIETAGSAKGPTVTYDTFGQRQFGFRHLQGIHDLEESTNETVLVLKINLSVCEQISSFYRSLLDNEELPAATIHNCQDDIFRFERRIQAVRSQMSAQILRSEALLRLIADRKTLLYGLLEFQNTKSNKLLASASQKSTTKMERMTKDMSVIARKTKTETVSMKIITLVTLFFLPGTFIATLMSTDIVHWTNNQKRYESGALQAYLAICLPFMVITFIVWAVFQWREKRKERLQNEQACV